MSLSKKQIQDLQQVLTPQERRFNILEVIEKYPDNPHMHETFREICLHYESACLSFKQIMAYLFGQFNNGVLTVNKSSGSNLDDQQAQKNHRHASLRIKKSNATEMFKVRLLSQNQRITSLVMDDSSQDEMFVVTNTLVRLFNMQKQSFGDQILLLPDEIIVKIAVSGNMIGVINKAHEFHVQVMPQKLEELQRKQTAKHHKSQISRVLVKKLPTSTKIVAIFGLTEEEWLICMPQKLLLLSLELSQGKTFSLNQRKMKLNQKNRDITVELACKLSSSFIGLISNQCTILIIDINDMSITHTMSNDTNFVCMCFNPDLNIIVASDFGGYLMSLTFNARHGDIEQQGMAKKETEQLLPLKTEFMETHYLGKSSKYTSTQASDKKKGKFISQQVSNKETRTQYTTIVQNTSRTPLQLLHTKSKSVFSYESKYGCIVKIWDIHTLQVYQKVALNMEIYELKASSLGLYLLSREKGYLCFYGLESNADELTGQGRCQAQVVELAISSNVLFIKTAAMGQVVVYKLKLFNKPVISEYSSRKTRNAEKVLKYCFYKDQMYLLDCSKHHAPFLDTYGIFGQAKQSVADLKQFHSMVAYSEKHGVVLWSSNRLHIRCKLNSDSRIMSKKFVKGQHILSNFNDNEPTVSAATNLEYSCTVLLHEEICKIKCMRQYLTVICNPIQGISNCYVIDESAMSIILHFSVSSDFRILECHRRCTLFRHRTVNNSVNNASESQAFDYFLFCNKSGETLWKSGDISGWTIESVNIINIEGSVIELVCIYKSSTGNNLGEKPIFYVAKYTINIQIEQKVFINLSKGNKIASNEVQTFQDMLNRSIFQKYGPASISNSRFRDRLTEKVNYKIFYTLDGSNNIELRSAQGNGKSSNLIDVKATTAKVLHYQNEQKIILFGVYGQSKVMLFQMEKEIVAECIGVLDFDILDSERSKNHLKSCIRYWNQKYKKEDEDLWEEAKSKAIRRVKNSRTPSPYGFLRSDSLRSTNKKWNPQNVEQGIVISDYLKKQNLTQKKIMSSDPMQINQLLHKHNIHESIIKQSEKAKKSKRHKQLEQNMMDIEGIRVLTSTVRLTKQSLFTESVSFKTKTVSMRKLKTEQSIDTKLQQGSQAKATPKRRLRYETEADQQLQKSKMIERTLLPNLITVRNDSVKLQAQKKMLIYDLLKKQQFSLQQSRCFQGRIQHT